jgi:3-deoxy-manno-octulosonate cytidylyltransferase (CMP-KDO synthetase)
MASVSPAPLGVVAVIPARFAATRLPGKPLADLLGKPMIQWVYEGAKRARGVDRVLIATDDERILEAAMAFGVPREDVLMTDPGLPSGTDRVAAVADRVPAKVYVNIQGDEPLMDPECVEAAAALVVSGRFPMGTAMTPIREASELDQVTVVKVLTDRKGRAIYFSRHPIPYSRGPRPGVAGPWICRRHLGLYAYTRETLFRIRSLPPSDIEKAEVLEQLRALEDGIAIGVAEVPHLSIGVDTPEDLEKVRGILAQGLGKSG